MTRRLHQDLVSGREREEEGLTQRRGAAESEGTSWKEDTSPCPSPKGFKLDGWAIMGVSP